MRTLKLTLAYDGTRFVGWQRQAAGESIQGLVEDALARFEGGRVVLHGAGRTDAGVHALAQVASAVVTLAHDAATLRRGLNAHLPADVRVVAVEEAPPDFHARFSARSKAYRYRICDAPVADPFERAFAWHLPAPLDLEAMNRGAAALVGRHDFAAFQSAGTTVSGTIRTVTRSAWRRHRGLLVYDVAADGFLRHMVRAIVGTLVEVGRGWRDAAAVEAIRDSRSRAAAGRTAPPHGLFLVGVDYH